MEILKSPEISGNLDFLNIQFLYNALLTFFMIFMCVVLMVYSSNYFIRLKSREMGLIVLSGLSFLNELYTVWFKYYVLSFFFNDWNYSFFGNKSNC